MGKSRQTSWCFSSSPPNLTGITSTTVRRFTKASQAGRRDGDRGNTRALTVRHIDGKRRPTVRTRHGHGLWKPTPHYAAAQRNSLPPAQLVHLSLIPQRQVTVCAPALRRGTSRATYNALKPAVGLLSGQFRCIGHPHPQTHAPDFSAPSSVSRGIRDCAIRASTEQLHARFR